MPLSHIWLNWRITTSRSFLTKFIFGLCPAILTEVFVQRPTTLLEAKRIAENLELTQSVVKLHQKSVKEKTTKAARHRGTQKRRSGRLYQSVQDRVQRKACRDRQNRYQTQTTTDYTKFSCISTHRGAHEVSCPVVHGPAAVWRSMLRDLPLGDRAGRVRRQGSVVMVNLEALAQRKEEKTSADVAVAGISANPPSGKSGKTRVYLRNRLLHRDRERETRARVRERRFVTSLLETLVSPTKWRYRVVQRGHTQCIAGLAVHWTEKGNCW